MNKSINITCVFLMACFSNPSIAQEGFYAGFGWNTYFAKEQVSNSDNSYNFTHSNDASSNGFLTQSLGDYGAGIQLGYRKNINNRSNEYMLTLEAQYAFNHQDVLLKNKFTDLEIETKANYNHGFRFAIGRHFNKIYPYLIIQASLQNVTPRNSSIQTGGIIYDVEDDGTILPSKLDSNGGSFSTEVVSFLGGIGVEIPLKEKLKLNIEYVPMKHLEYGIRDIENEDIYFVNNLVINQLQIGLRYYFASSSE